MSETLKKTLQTSNSPVADGRPLISLLTRKLAYFPGGQDKSGTPVLIVPVTSTNNSTTATNIPTLQPSSSVVLEPSNNDVLVDNFNATHTIPPISPTNYHGLDQNHSRDLEAIFQYFYKILTEVNTNAQFTVILDGRQACWRLLRHTAEIVQSVTNPAFISALIAIKPELFWEKQHVDCMRDRQEEKVTYVSVPKLHRLFVDSSDLPEELGGSMSYQHSQWVHNRLRFEDFVRESRIVMSGLDSIFSRLEHSVALQKKDGGFRLAEWMAATEILYKEHIELARKLEQSGRQLVVSLETDEESGFKLAKADGSLTEYTLSCQNKVKDILSQIRTRVGQSEELYTELQCGIQHATQVRSLENHIGQVITWILGPGAELLGQLVLRGIGKDSSSVTLLQQELENVEVKCRETYGRYAEARQKLEGLLRTNLIVPDDLKSRKNFMDNVCRTFAGLLERRRRVLLSSTRFHRTLDQFHAKLAEALRVAQTTEVGEEPRAAETAMSLLDDYQRVIGELCNNAESEAQKLLDLLTVAPRDAVGRELAGYDQRSDQQHVENLLHRIQDGQERLQQAWAMERLRLRRIIEIGTCEKDAQQALSWLHDLCNVMRTSQGRVGCHISEVYVLKQQQQKFQETARGTYEYGSGLLMAALVLRRSAGLPADNNRHLAAELGQAWTLLLAAVREQISRLRVAGVFYRDMAQHEKDIIALMKSLPKLCASQSRHSNEEIWQPSSFPAASSQPTPSNRNSAVEAFLENRESLLQAVGRTIRLGKLLKGRILDPLLTGEGFDSCPDNKLAAETISNAIVDITNLAQQLDDAICRHSQEVGLSSITEKSALMDEELKEQKNEEHVNDSSSGDEFLTVCESLDKQSSLSCYQTASDCSCSDLSRESSPSSTVTNSEPAEKHSILVTETNKSISVHKKEKSVTFADQVNAILLQNLPCPSTVDQHLTVKPPLESISVAITSNNLNNSSLLTTPESTVLVPPGGRSPSLSEDSGFGTTLSVCVVPDNESQDMDADHSKDSAFSDSGVDCWNHSIELPDSCPYIQTSVNSDVLFRPLYTISRQTNAEAWNPSAFAQRMLAILDGVRLDQADQDADPLAKHFSKTKEWLRLTILEMSPGLTHLGETWEEAYDMQTNHHDVLHKLQNKQSPVEELLKQADQLIANQKPKAEVYAAMAESLGQAWKDLNWQLEQRKYILDANVAFHSRARECLDKLVALEHENRSEHMPTEVEDVKRMLTQQAETRRSALEAHRWALQEGEALLDRLRTWQDQGSMDSRPGHILFDVKQAINQVERWLESLHDRRRISNVLFVSRKKMLDQCLAVSTLRKDLQDVLQQLQNKHEQLLSDSNLGDSSASAELHLFEHNKLPTECKELKDRALKLVRIAEQLAESQSYNGEEARAEAYALLEKISEYLEAVDLRSSLLSMAVTFFRIAQAASTKLDQLEVQLTAHELPNGSPQLAQLHAQVSRALEDASAPALHHGHTLLDKAGRGQPGTEGVQSMVKEIENRGIHLGSLCTAHKEESLRIMQAIHSFIEQYDSLYSWLINIAEAFMKSQLDMGTTSHTAREVLDLHTQMMNDMVIKGSLMQGLLQSLPSLQEVAEESQALDLQMKADQLQNIWDKLHFHLESRILLLQAYVRFHSLALQVSESQDELENELGKDEKTEIKDDAWLRSVQESWLNVQQKYMQLSHTGRNFIADASQANERYLDLEKACLCVESILDHLGNRELHIGQQKETVVSYISTTKETTEIWTSFITELHIVMDSKTNVDLHMYPILPTENTAPSTVISLVEQKNQEVQTKAASLITNATEKLQQLQQFKLPGNEEAKAQAAGDLMRFQQQIELKTAEYRRVVQSIIAFYRNLQEFDRVVESLKHQQLPNNVPGIDHALQEHSSAKETISELLHFAGNEAEQLLSQLRSLESTSLTQSDIQVVSGELPKRQVQWSLYWEERYSQLIQHRQRCQFNDDLHLINVQLDELMRQLSTMTGAFGVSLTSAQTTSQAFTQFERTVKILETRIHTFVSTAQKMLKDEEADRTYIEKELAQINTKWSSFDRQVGESRKMIDLSLEYFTLVEQVEEWFKEGSKLLVTIARKSTTCKTPADANELLEEVDTFLKPGEALQDERIRKISTLAIQLYGNDSSRQMGQVLQENKEMMDSFSVINSELSFLAENLQAAEEERVQQAQTQVEVQESLNTARAEAAAAKTAALAAEEARKAAEAAALLFTQHSENAPPRPPLPAAESLAPPSQRIRLNEIPVQKSGPIFTTPLRDVVVEEGQSFTFECEVTGHPVPHVTWLKDGLPIQNNPDYRTSFKDGICRLSIDETFTEDSAKFTCQASNEAGFAHTSATLKVHECQAENLVGPEFMTFLEPAHVQEGQPFEWRCQVQGQPLPIVSWYKDGVCVDSHPDYVITFNNGQCVLRFAEVFIEDQGEYCCRAVNDAGDAETLASLTVEPLEPTEIPQFIVPLSNVMVRAGQKVKLECQFSGIPAPTLVWLYNGRILKETRDLKTHVDGNQGFLTLTEAYPKDAGAYTVIAKNIAGESSCTCQLSVKGRLPTETSDSELASDVEPIKPSIHAPLKDQTVSEGQSVRLDCVIVGQPEPEVIWFRNDRPVKESSDFQLLFQGDRCSLVIKEAFAEDSGRYKVVAINSGGEASSQCQLTVLASPEHQPEPPITIQIETQAPKFTRLTQDVSVAVGEKINFEAQVVGKPSPVISWYRDGGLLSHSTNFQITTDLNGTTQLTIPQVQLYHSGTYTVKASNEAGEAKCYATLMVLPQEPSADSQVPRVPPQFQKLFTDMSVLKGTPVTLECIVQGNPYPEVKWLFNMSPVVSNEGVTVTSEGFTHQLNIQQAEEEHKGRYTCIAESEAGRAVCTASLQVQQPTLLIPSLGNYADNYSQTTFQSTTLVRKATVQSNTVVNSVTSESHTSLSQTSGQPADIVHAQKVQQIENGDEGVSVKQRASFFASQSGQITTSDTKSQSVVKPLSKGQRKAIAPKFVTPLVGVMVEEDARVVFHGIVDSFPEPEIKWYKNGVDLVTMENMDISFDLNKVSLVLKQVKEADAGRYTCTARNSAGTASSTADLVVRRTQFPPVFGRRLQAQVVTPGSRVTLEVEVTGTPLPEVAWTKNESPIQLDDRMAFKTEGSRHSLVISNVNKSDSGRYAVKASNRAGEAQSIADVLVAPTQLFIETTTGVAGETEGKIVSTRTEERTVKTTSEILAARPSIPPTTYSSVVDVAAAPSAPAVASTQNVTSTTITRQRNDTNSLDKIPTEEKVDVMKEINMKTSTVVQKTLKLDTTLTTDAHQTDLVLTPEPPPAVSYAPKLGSPPKLREDVFEKARKLEEACKTPTDVPGGVRLLPLPTPPVQEKPTQNFQKQPQLMQTVSEKTATQPQASLFEPFPELEPFPFEPSPAKPKPPKTAPPPKPKKFVKGLSRESDYESDFEGKIPPKWVPHGSDTEDLSFQPVNVVLQTNSLCSSQVRQKEPTPPTVFDNPPQIDSIRPQVLSEDHTKTTRSVEENEVTTINISKVKTLSSRTTQRYKTTDYFSDSEVRHPGRVQNTVYKPQQDTQQPETAGQERRPAQRSTQSMERHAVPRKKPSAQAIAMEHSWVPKRNSGDETVIQTSSGANKVGELSNKPSKQALEMEKRWGHTLKPLHVSWPPPPSEVVKVELPWMKKEEDEEFSSTVANSSTIRTDVQLVTEIPPTITQKVETTVRSEPVTTKIIEPEQRSEIDSSTGLKAGEGKSFWEAKLLAEQSDALMATCTRPTTSYTGQTTHSSSVVEVRKSAETVPTPGKEKQQTTSAPPAETLKPTGQPSSPDCQKAEKVNTTRPLECTKREIPQDEKIAPPFQLPSVSHAPTVGLPLKSDVGEVSETTQRMNFTETTQYSKRFVTMEQSSRVIQFSDSSSARMQQNQVETNHLPTPGSPPTFEVAPPVQPTTTPLILEPFPFTPSPARPAKTVSSTPPARPKKFIPGEARESDYESDYEGTRIRPKWTPACSDAEEPTFKTVRAPSLGNTLPRTQKREKRRSPTPPTVFDQPPQFDGPPRPLITPEDVEKLKEAFQVDVTPAPTKSGQPKIQVQKPKTVESSKPYIPSQAYPLAPTFSAAYFSEPELHLQAGEAPEFGYIAAHTTASKMVNQQFSAMSQTFKEKAQNFAEQVLTQVNNNRTQQEPEPPAPSPQTTNLSDSEPVAVQEPKASEPQAYHEESRVSEYGTKHIDQDTGLIYFKYDFGYEFGLVLPGEAKKVDKIESLIGTEGNTEVPVLHEHAPPSNVSANPATSNPVNTTCVTATPTTTAPGGPNSVPLFKPKRFTQFKAAKWEPFTTDSELSEIEREMQSDRGSSKYYETRRSSFTPYQAPQPCGMAREQLTPSPQSSLSVSPRESMCLRPRAVPAMDSTQSFDGGRGKSAGELR